MVAIFSNFTTTFFFFVGLIILGIVFEKQLIAFEDKFDAWVASKRGADNKTAKQPRKSVKVKANTKPSQKKDSTYRGFAA